MILKDNRAKFIILLLLVFMIGYLYYHTFQKEITEGYTTAIPGLVKKMTAPYTTGRLDKCLESYPKADPQFEEIQLTYKNKYFGGREFDLKLSDFYIAGSYKSYIPCGYTADIQSYDAIKKVLEMGARVIHLDLYSNESLDNPLVEIRVEKPMKGEFNKPLQFEKICELISKNAWLGHNYPLFLYLDIHFTDKYLYQQMAKHLLTHFKKRLMSQKYGFKRYNMGQVSIKDALGRVVIILSKYPNDGLLDELTNEATSDKHQYLKIIDYTEANMNYGGVKATETDGVFLVNFNKFNMTFCKHDPDHKYDNVVTFKNDIENIDSSDPRKYGVHSVLAYYNKDDEYIGDYLAYFKKCSFVVKPDSLRYIPKPKKPIKKQDKRLYYKPITTTVPGIGGLPWLKFNH